MKKLLFNLYFWPIFIIVTTLGLTLLPFILLFNKIFLGRGIARSLRLAIRLYGWIFVCVVPFRAPVRVIGDTMRIPSPAIFVANHTSAIDPYLFGAIPAENCFVTSWPFKIPVYSPLMKLAGYINTADGWTNIRQKCSALLSQGSSIIIWPEGHRSRNGKMGRFRKGAFQLAVETGHAIQPVCIVGSGNIMSPGEKLLTPGKVSLILLDPIFPVAGDKRCHQKQIHELRQRAFDAIQQCVLKNQTSAAGEQHISHIKCTGKTSESLHRHPHDFC